MDLLQGNELARLAVAAFEDLEMLASASYARLECEGGKRTVAYVPSPSFSSCWNELGFLLSMAAMRVSVSRLWMLMELGSLAGGGRFSPWGEGGKVRKGGRAEGFGREVYRGSKRTEDGVRS